MGNKVYLTIEEVAHRLHIRVGTARNRISREDPMPPYSKVGRRLLFAEDELEAWLKNRTVSNDNHSTGSKP